jgi:peroxiredoxin
MRLSKKRQGGRLEIGGRQAAGILIGLAVFCGVGMHPRSADAAEGVCTAGAKAADLNLKFKDIQGKPVALSDYKGKVVLLDFWATWCPPCRKEIPGFIELYNSYRARGLVVIGVSMDDSPSDVKPFAKQLKINYPIVMGTGREEEFKQAYGELPLPTAFVIARDGTICARHDGLTAKDEFEREITSLLQ